MKLDPRVTKAARLAAEAVAVAVALGVCSVWYARGVRLLARDYWREYVG